MCSSESIQFNFISGEAESKEFPYAVSQNVAFSNMLSEANTKRNKPFDFQVNRAHYFQFSESFKALLGYIDMKFPKKIEWLCGGNLISENFILTNAHCLTGARR